MKFKSTFLVAALSLFPILAMADEYNITSFGAVGNGKKMNTESIQKAIDKCYENGGGSVIIPAGDFLTGSIQLKSNVTLNLTTGARLIGSKDLKDYPNIGYRHNEFGEVKSLIWSIEANNVSIIGNGEINFNGETFMDFKTFNVNRAIERTDNYNDRQKKEAVVKFLERPNQPIFFHKCKNVRVNGISMRNSPCWTLTLSDCFKAVISSIMIDNNPQIPNSDGIHLTASKDVVITDCELYAGDDCIAITCITDWDNTSENIVVSNSVFSSRSACVRVGHQASKIKNVIVSNIVMKDSNRGIAVFSGKDGYVENVSFENIIMQTQKYAGGWWGKGEPLVVVAFENGRINDVSVSKIKASTENSIVISGKHISNIKLQDWDMSIAQGNNISHFKPLYELSPAPFVESPDPMVSIPCIYAENIEGLSIDGFSAKALHEEGNNTFCVMPVFKQLRETSINNLIVK